MFIERKAVSMMGAGRGRFEWCSNGASFDYGPLRHCTEEKWGQLGLSFRQNTMSGDYKRQEFRGKVGSKCPSLKVNQDLPVPHPLALSIAAIALVTSKNLKHPLPHNPRRRRASTNPVKPAASPYPHGQRAF